MFVPIRLFRGRGHPRLDLGIIERGGSRRNARANREVGTHEVDADGGDVALGVCIVGETEQKARFADAGVTDQLRRDAGWRGEYFGETFDEGGISAEIWAGRRGHRGTRGDGATSTRRLMANQTRVRTRSLKR